MEKIYIFIAAAVAVFSIVSCSKEKIEQPSAQKDNPSIEISVISIDGTIDDGITTKAAKTGWSAGDKINIIILGPPFFFFTPVHPVPSLQIFISFSQNNVFTFSNIFLILMACNPFVICSHHYPYAQSRTPSGSTTSR